MRLKSVPRHLPRKFCTLKKLLQKKSVAESMEFLSKMKSEGGTVNIRTVNFNNYFDIIKEVDVDCHKIKNKSQLIDIKPEIEPLESFHVNGKSEILDLTNTGTCEKSSATTPLADAKLKDTYLYQIMTNPDFLKKISQDKHFIKKQCSHCKKEFSSEDELRSHTNVQTDQLMCCVCGKSFAQKRYLRYHQRCHSERNKFQCDFCSKKYSRLDNLTRHSVFHTNPGKFPCNACDRSFARKDLLNKHLKCHENKHKHYCHLCQKYFRGPASLNNHVKLLHSDSELLVDNYQCEK